MLACSWLLLYLSLQSSEWLQSSMCHWESTRVGTGGTPELSSLSEHSQISENHAIAEQTQLNISRINIFWRGITFTFSWGYNHNPGSRCWADTHDSEPIIPPEHDLTFPCIELQGPFDCPVAELCWLFVQIYPASLPGPECDNLLLSIIRKC